MKLILSQQKIILVFLILFLSTSLLNSRKSRKLKQSNLTKVKIFINDNDLFDNKIASADKKDEVNKLIPGIDFFGAIDSENFFFKDKEGREGFNLIYENKDKGYPESFPFKLSSEPSPKLLNTFIPLAESTNLKITINKGILTSFSFEFTDKIIKVQIISDKKFSDIKDINEFRKVLSLKFISQALKEFTDNKIYISEQIEWLKNNKEDDEEEMKIIKKKKKGKKQDIEIKVIETKDNNISSLNESLKKAKEKLKNNLAFLKSQNISKEEVNQILDSNFKSEKEKFEEVKEIFEDIINDKV